MMPALKAVFVSFVGTLLVTHSYACGNVDVISGSSCASLVLNFNLKSCGGEEKNSPRITCKDGLAFAKFRAAKVVYQARIRSLNTGDGVLWVPGDLASTPLKAPKPAKEPKREIAYVRNPSPEPVPSPAEAKKDEGKIEISGIFDAYYSGNFNKPASGRSSIRLFDLYTNQFVLNLAELTFRKKSGNVGFVLDADFGEQPELEASQFTLTPSGGPQTSLADDVTKHVGQAFVTYRPENGPLYFEFGKMLTYIGYESMKPTETINYSKGNMIAFAMPIWHDGIHVSYDLVPEKYTIGAYAYDGWNSALNSTLGKTLGLQFKGQVTEAFSLQVNTIRDADRMVSELILNEQIGDKVTMALDSALGTVFGFWWWGSALYYKYRFNPVYYLGFRIEDLEDTNGALLGGVGQNLAGVTLTNGFTLEHGLELRLEGRYDHSSSNIRFESGNSSSPNQVTVTAGVMLLL